MTTSNSALEPPTSTWPYVDARLPNSLLRFENQEEHALNIIAGQLRFGSLTYFRSNEGAHGDRAEGLVSFKWNLKSGRNIQYRGRSMNDYYIFCTTHPEVNLLLMTNKYGKFVVHIHNPQELLARIKVAWRDHEFAFADNAVVTSVEYNKDELHKPNQELRAPPRYAYSQKHMSYSDDHEFRYVLPCSDAKRTLDDHLTLDVGDCRDIACLRPY